jgi:hypothetical protein
MKRVLSEIGYDKPSNSETISDLTALYCTYSERLRECADFRSNGNEAQDLAVEAMENDLHDLQCHIINLASKITLKSGQDIKDLLDFWHIVQVQSAPDEISLSDRVIMNIRDYYDEAIFKY